MEYDHEITSHDNGREKKRFMIVRRRMNKRRMIMCISKNDLLPRYASSGSKQKFTSSSPPCHVVFKYLVPLLAALVTMQYQSKGKDPFEARPINMWCFCIATSIYCLAMGIRNQIQTPKYLQILLSHVILVAGVLSSVSLGSVILPPRFRGQLIIFAVLVFLPIILARNILKRGYVWIYNGVTNVAALIIPNVVIGWNVTAEPNPSQPA
ncbi:unnamed protein product [Ilex paraguariensis]